MPQYPLPAEFGKNIAVGFVDDQFARNDTTGASRQLFSASHGSPDAPNVDVLVDTL